jgi:hypothetical protein
MKEVMVNVDANRDEMKAIHDKMDANQAKTDTNQMRLEAKMDLHQE